jgi:carbon-monoxide dehydrogenase medium subunit
MHAFEYHAPRNVAKALALLAEHGANAQLLAGGTDLIVKMRVHRSTPHLVIDAKKITELGRLKLGDDGLSIGAAVSCRRIYENRRIARLYPALTEAAALIGGIAIQGRASIGGNLCNAAPSADTIPALIALGAVVHLRSPRGERRLPVEAVCTAPGRTVLAADELLVAIAVPAPGPRSGAKFLRFIPRNEMDIAVVNAAASVTVDESGQRCTAARIAVGAVAPTPLYVPEAGAALIGRPVGDEAIAAAAAAAREAARPIHDMRGTVEQRKHLTGVLVERAVRGALARARGERA